MILDKKQKEIVESDSKDILVIAGAGSGKALMNGTKVKTPSGDVNIEDLVVGDKVFGADGKPHSVTGVYPQGKKRVYNVVFSDGTVIPSSDDHLWNIQTASMRNNNRGFKTVTKT